MKILEEDGEIRWSPIKKRDEVSCGNRECAVFSHYWKCYNGKETGCHVYRRWKRECREYVE